MLSLSPEILVQWLQTLPVEAVEVACLLIAYTAPLVMMRLFGAGGLYTMQAVSILVANVQVVKQVQFSMFADPVAIGTAVFASTYLSGDLLTEYYGPKAARRGVYIGFASLLLWTILLVLTMGYRPLDNDPTQTSLLTLFMPVPALFAAGMTSYLIGELNDIWLFQKVRRLTGQGRLWLRTNVSAIVSTLLDNTIFSTLAWVVFAVHPVGLHELIFTYILGTSLMRIVYSFCDTPFMYLSRLIAPRAPDYRAPNA